MDERIKLIWLETSGSGQSMCMTTYPLYSRLSSNTYFNKITRNNQGNVNDNM